MQLEHILRWSLCTETIVYDSVLECQTVCLHKPIQYIPPFSSEYMSWISMRGYKPTGWSPGFWGLQRWTDFCAALSEVAIFSADCVSCSSCGLLICCVWHSVRGGNWCNFSLFWLYHLCRARWGDLFMVQLRMGIYTLANVINVASKASAIR